MQQCKRYNIRTSRRCGTMILYGEELCYDCKCDLVVARATGGPIKPVYSPPASPFEYLQAQIQAQPQYIQPHLPQMVFNVTMCNHGTYGNSTYNAPRCSRYGCKCTGTKSGKIGYCCGKCERGIPCTWNKHG